MYEVYCQHRKHCSTEKQDYVALKLKVLLQIKVIWRYKEITSLNLQYRIKLTNYQSF